jgi:cytochrome c5
MSREQMTMEPASGQRNVAKEQYANVRRSLTVFEERVVARYWDEDTPARTGFGRFLGSLDRLAGWLLDDEEISRRGRALMRQGAPAETHEKEAPPRKQLTAPLAADETAAPVAEAEAASAADEEPEAVAASAADEEPEAEATSAADEDPGGARLVEVTFTFPADVQVGRVVLCGEFNQWAVEGFRLDQGDDGIWRTVVALEPGRSYRYRYLVDGERWENAPGADQYVPNPYGSVDSVVTVEATAP